MPTRHNPIRATATAVAEPPPNLTVLPAPVPAGGGPATGLRKVSFGKAKKAGTEDGKTKYPEFNDPVTKDQVLAIAARIKERSGQIEALEGAQKTDKAELKMFVSPFYFTVNHRQAAPPSSIAINSDKGEVLVTYQNRYPALESESAIIPILGDDTDKHFRQTFTLKINGELLPKGSEQAIVDDLMAVLDKHNASDALEVKEEIKPTANFHLARHTLFTPEVNLRLEEVCPIVAMIKTKGRGK